MKEDLELIAEAYLDGHLNPEEKASFEELLLTEEGSEALGQALMLRYLMHELLPKHTEQALIDSIHEILLKELAQKQESQSIGLMDRILQPFQFMGLALNGPRAALNRASSTSRDLKTAAKGAGTISYSLGSLRSPVLEKRKQMAENRPSLWKMFRKLVRR